MATIRENDIDRAVETLRAYQSASAGGAVENLTDDESEIIRKHRIERARVALENMGIVITAPLVVYPPRQTADFAFIDGQAVPMEAVS